ncbi:MAG: 3-carboxymuconate cyclase [Verrucomicrobiaceae bacterium]|nr:3-carboxymuconate cyclase [Verrucomicrobiaceae bacterium]
MKTLHALVLGMVITVGGAATAQAVPVVEKIFTFPDGEGSWDSMTLAPDGYFYGTANVDANAGLGGYGTVFRYRASDGAFETIAKFSETSGYNPNPHLVLAADGNLYGTTVYGGTYGCGSVFKIAPDLAQPLTVTDAIRTPPPGFPGSSDGHYKIYGPMPAGVLTIITQTPVSVGYVPSPLILGPDGDLYGCMVTSLSPANDAYHGSVFKVTTSGVMTKLVGFPASYDSFPGRVAFGPDGNIYGTTFNGNTQHGHVFRLANGEITNVVDLDGMQAGDRTGITLGNDGNFYGMTDIHSDYMHVIDWGTAFRLTPDGQLTVLAGSSRSTGFNPSGGLALGSDGNFYGVNQNGGMNGYYNAGGNVFRLTPQGEYTVLAEFTAREAPSLYAPLGSVSFGPDGNLYGTALGGADYHGGIFRVTLSEPVFPTIAQRPKVAAPPPIALRKMVLDRDRDGVADHIDAYPGTLRGEPVNKRGASISQLVPASRGWKNRGQYVNAVTQTANTFRTQRVITAAQSSSVIRNSLKAKIRIAAQ